MSLIKRPLIACKDALKRFQEEPISSFYIVLVVALLVLGQRWALKWAFHDTKEIKVSELLEVWAIILVLTGTVWTAFGVVVSPKARRDLTKLSLDKYIDFKINPQLYKEEPADPVKEIISALFVASNFATSGLFLITLGSLLLLLKMVLPA